jgi:diacylglycerol kinase family enzyme
MSSRTDSPHVHVILNERSGTLSKDGIAEQVVEFFRSRRQRVQVVVAHTGAELIAAARDAARGDADVVVAGGGDGTIGAIAGHLVHTNKALGVLPLGTFNYFARRFDVPLDVDGALEVIAGGTIVTADVGEVNGRVFLNNSSIGLYSAVLQQRETTYRKLGRSRAVAYASVALVLVQPPALLNLQLEIDGVRLARRTPLLFVGTNEFQMETFGIPGRTCVRAGHLASYITRPLGLVPLWRLALRAFFRGLHGATELEVVCARELRVTLRRKRVRAALDGELVTLESPLEFRMRPGALAVLAGAARAGRTEETG